MATLVCCPVWLRLTWPLTVSCHLKKVVVSCVLPTQGPVSSGGPTATLGTDVSRLPYWPKAVEEPFQALDKRTSAMSSFKCLLKT